MLYDNQDYIYTSRNPCCMTTKITYILHEIHVVSQPRLHIYLTKSMLYHNQDYIYFKSKSIRSNKNNSYRLQGISWDMEIKR